MGDIKFTTDSFKEVSPSLIISRAGPTEIEKVFLGLSLIYNDLKDLFLLSSDYETKYAPADGANHHSGEYSGMMVHIDRMILGLTSAFLQFIQKNRKVLSGIPFHFFLKDLSQKQKDVWNNIYKVATKDAPSAEDNFYSFLYDIRSNTIFHYDENLKVLVQGFDRKFSTLPKSSDNKNEYAYYSQGKDVRGTRYHYADAAAEEYIRQKIEHKNFDREELKQLIHEILLILKIVIDKYLMSK
jgi:hypothetical protein